jgi:hypothetical protein
MALRIEGYAIIGNCQTAALVPAWTNGASSGALHAAQEQRSGRYFDCWGRARGPGRNHRDQHSGEHQHRVVGKHAGLLQSALYALGALGW